MSKVKTDGPVSVQKLAEEAWGAGPGKVGQLKDDDGAGMLPQSLNESKPEKPR